MTTDTPSDPRHLAPATPSLRNRAMMSAFVTLGGHGAGHVIRLASNLVLTRLLFPEAFGLMAIVGMFMLGVHLLSDTGIRPAIVQHKRGLEESFLNTAWTINIIRGFFVWAIVTVIAWPVAALYDDTRFLWLLPLVGSTAAIAGFTSTAVDTANRELMLGRVTLIELLSQLVGAATMIGWAMLDRSINALVAGGIIASFVTVGLSHTILSGVRHRLCWDREARHDLFNFGRWIIISTAFTFLAMQGDRAILSSFVGMATIGVYSIAANLSQAVSTLCSKLTSSVLFPVYSRWGREDPKKLVREVRRVRVRTLWAFLLPPALLAVVGEPLIRVLYDSRYDEAGWILALLSIGIIPQMIIATAEPVLLATGDSYRHMILNISRTTVTLVAMGTGAYLEGVRGLVIGSIVGSLLQYPLLALAIRGKGVWMPKLDLVALMASFTFVLLGRMLLGASAP